MKVYRIENEYDLKNDNRANSISMANTFTNKREYDLPAFNKIIQKAQSEIPGGMIGFWGHPEGGKLLPSMKISATPMKDKLSLSTKGIPGCKTVMIQMNGSRVKHIEECLPTLTGELIRASYQGGVGGFSHSADGIDGNLHGGKTIITTLRGYDYELYPNFLPIKSRGYWFDTETGEEINPINESTITELTEEEKIDFVKEELLISPILESTLSEDERKDQVKGFIAEIKIAQKDYPKTEEFKSLIFESMNSQANALAESKELRSKVEELETRLKERDEELETYKHMAINESMSESIIPLNDKQKKAIIELSGGSQNKAEAILESMASRVSMADLPGHSTPVTIPSNQIRFEPLDSEGEDANVGLKEYRI